MRTDVQIRQLRSFVFGPFLTMTLLNYESAGKNDDQENKENQDKTDMPSKSDNCAHSHSLLSNKILLLYCFISEMLG
jgi:hypothetical protein